MNTIVNTLKYGVKAALDYPKLPSSGKRVVRRDLLFGLAEDPGIERSVEEGITWLCAAQDNSASGDGGVSRHYSLIDGWAPSYPETTGYIVPTMLNYARMKGDESIRQRAKTMLDWLVSIQLPSGGFQGGLISSKPVVPVTFNSGQILIGLAEGVKELGDEYYDSMRNAADWLVQTQDPDGCWRRFPTPFAASGEKIYETHVAYGLFEASRIDSNEQYAEAAVANVKWALKYQKANGWFGRCCLDNPSQPLTHTIGYALRGIIEAYRFTKDKDLKNACIKAADGILVAFNVKNGYLPGRVNSDWEGTVSWACLTGNAQIALCWLLLFEDTGNDNYREAAFSLNRFVRKTIRIEGRPGMRGGIKGSFPVYGTYGAYQYLNWACKFFIDSNMLEQEIRDKASSKNTRNRA